MHRLLRLLPAALACLLMGRGAVATDLAQEDDPLVRVTIQFADGKPASRWVAPGQWIPYGCSLAVPYRWGSSLRFERREECLTVSIDGGPEQTARISVHNAGGLDILSRELARGRGGFTVMCRPKELSSLPPLPAGRDIALTVLSSLADFAPLAQQHAVAALSLNGAKLTDLAPIADFADLTSLRLNGWQDGETDLRPLSRLTKLTWLRLVSLPKVTDLSPLAALPNLQGLELRFCRELADLAPLASARRLRMLKVYNSPAITDAAPLAKLPNLQVLCLQETSIADLAPLASLTRLVELDLSRCKGISDLRPLRDLDRLESVNLSNCDAVTDLAPLRHVLRRGGDVRVSAALKPQLEKLRDGNDL